MFPSLDEGKNCKIFLGLQLPSDHPTVFKTNQTYSAMPCFAQALVSMHYFPNH